MSDLTIDIVYADDIRTEQSGQLSIIGAYPGAIGVSSFPHVFPKLAFWVRITMNIDSQITPTRLVVADGEEIYASMDLSDFASQKSHIIETALGLSNDRPTTVEIGLTSIVSPLICKKSTTLTPRIEYEGGAVFGRPLMVNLLSDQHNITMKSH